MLKVSCDLCRREAPITAGAHNALEYPEGWSQGFFYKAHYCPDCAKKCRAAGRELVGGPEGACVAAPPKKTLSFDEIQRLSGGSSAAFPVVGHGEPPDPLTTFQMGFAGMTYRQWLIGQALEGTASVPHIYTPEEAGIKAIQIADGVLELLVEARRTEGEADDGRRDDDGKVPDS